jgi:tetratricopeptide (TPR) repeat protein
VVKSRQNYEKALRDSEEVVRLLPKNAEAYKDRASVYALQKQADKAIQNLERSFELGYRKIDHIEREPSFNSVRSDPRYIQLVRRYRR